MEGGHLKTISSQAGTRLARARAAERAAFDAYNIGETQGQFCEWRAAIAELNVAGALVADELVAAGFADAEGDDA